jgi:hypothetical protein
MAAAGWSSRGVGFLGGEMAGLEWPNGEEKVMV